jgi:hypothetical protein
LSPGFDKLIVEGQRSPIGDADRIISFDDFFGSVAKRTVADDEAKAVCSKESLIIICKPVYNAG